MNFRWYISTLIIILTLLGVVNKQQISEPNQEIVLQFTNTKISSEDTHNTIVNIKKQLEGLGVNNIQVNEKENGKLIITYYSDVDVTSIKETLSSNDKLALNTSNPDENKKHSGFPLDENSSSYNLDIYEIQKSSDSNWDLNGTFVTELKSEANRFSNPNSYAFINIVDVRGTAEKVAYKTHCNITIAIDNTSHKIPEVRAGPLA